MFARDIPAFEAAFRADGLDSTGRRHALTPLSVAIPGENRQLNVVRLQPADGNETYYTAEAFHKERVVLHFTTGYIRGDVAMLTKPKPDPATRVSVAFLLARDGNIYNLFNSRYWAYHLGPTAVGGNTQMSRSSIGVEISNIGPLVPQGQSLTTTTSQDVYCHLNEPIYYRRASYRGFNYYASFTEAQYNSLIALLRYLTARFNIPRRFLPLASRYETRNDIANFRGIVSHVNFRTDKFDIGPAFEWERVIRGVTA
ncbi:MAG: N-acetylmuramoyl-L-alanine amidase [candidate division KSB1 bacterium]|nr:N-acetylmuramoyl-L-alanine amidase [candidate division KSB1 bacterium]MDZ7364811.1 N-acetylmuramoyl-L-alanine amidase [candidate division KSB1 bacterium]MDZ7402914.1 N-acetylmuramoyl-L-alanine amidase [candidate division KSB1 bacterium]